MWCVQLPMWRYQDIHAKFISFSAVCRGVVYHILVYVRECLTCSSMSIALFIHWVLRLIFSAQRTHARDGMLTILTALGIKQLECTNGVQPDQVHGIELQVADGECLAVNPDRRWTGKEGCER